MKVSGLIVAVYSTKLVYNKNIYREMHYKLKYFCMFN